MYAVIQTRLKPNEHGNNHLFGIASKERTYTNLTGPLEGIRFDDIAVPLKTLAKEEFQDVNVGFYLVLE